MTFKSMVVIYFSGYSPPVRKDARYVWIIACVYCILN